MKRVLSITLITVLIVCFAGISPVFAADHGWVRATSNISTADHGWGR